MCVERSLTRLSAPSPRSTRSPASPRSPLSAPSPSARYAPHTHTHLTNTSVHQCIHEPQHKQTHTLRRRRCVTHHAACADPSPSPLSPRRSSTLVCPWRTRTSPSRSPSPPPAASSPSSTPIRATVRSHYTADTTRALRTHTPHHPPHTTQHTQTALATLTPPLAMEFTLTVSKSGEYEIGLFRVRATSPCPCRAAVCPVGLVPCGVLVCPFLDVHTVALGQRRARRVSLLRRRPRGGLQALSDVSSDMSTL